MFLTKVVCYQVMSPSIYLKTHFSFPSHLFPPLLSLHFCVLFVWCVLLCCFYIPKLKLTYLQIKEQTARDIRQRTEARQAQLLQQTLLLQPTFKHKATQTEDFEETDSEGEEDTERERLRFTYVPQLFVLVLVLCFLIYLAGKQT
jgi:hypothetical protein